jgi:hypothetical protein
VQQDRGDEGKVAVWLLQKDSTRRRKRVKRGGGAMVSGTLYRALRKRGVGGGLAWGHREEGGWGVVSQFCAVGRLWVMLLEAAARALCGGGLLNRGGRQGVHDVGRWGACG